MRALLIAFLSFGCTRPNPSGVMDFSKVSTGNTPSGVDCATQSDCGSCCVSAHTQGHNTWVDTVRICECTSVGNGSCAQDCTATFCANQTPDPFCQSCLETDLSSNVCLLTSACAGDSECTAFVTCLGGCPG